MTTKENVAPLEQDKKDLIRNNSQYRVDLNWAHTEFEKLKAEIAKERVTLTDQQRAELEANKIKNTRSKTVYDETTQKENEHRHQETIESLANRQRADKEKTDRKARAETKVEWLLSETPEEKGQRKSELSRWIWAVRNYTNA
jgi:hypothetical protein